jgi:hypothetical protein
MRVFSLHILPGTPSRPGDREGSEKCSKCGFKFNRYATKRRGEWIYYCCPRCGDEKYREKH